MFINLEVVFCAFENLFWSFLGSIFELFGGLVADYVRTRFLHLKWCLLEASPSDFGAKMGLKMDPKIDENQKK